MVVVPAFAERQNGDKPVVCRIVRRVKRSRAENVRQRIDEPGRMPADDDAHENAPQNHRPAADCV